MQIPYESPRRRPRIEIIPLIDIIFFLLATFIMVSLSMVKNQGIPVRLPQAATGQAQSTEQFLTVSVTKNGAFYLDRKRMSFEELCRRLKTLSQQNKELKVILNGDESASFGEVVKVLDEMSTLGMDHVAMRTTPAR